LQFNSIDEFLAHIRNIEERLFYLKDELTTKEAAIYLGMSVSTLYKKTMNSEIPFYRPSTRHLYFKRQELAQWMLQNRHATNEELQAEATLSGKTNLYTPKRSKRKQPQKTEKR
jgi:excisionase family DNA binding protein